MAEDNGRKPEDDDAEDQDVDDDAEDAADDDWKPPTKAEYEAAVKRGNDDAKKYRLRLKTYREKFGDLNDAPPAKTGDKPPAKTGDAPDRDAIRAEVRGEIEGEFKEKAKESDLRAAVSVALMSAGLALPDDVASSATKARREVGRVVSMMNLRNMSLDEDDEVEGLDDEIADLKAKFPGLFTTGQASKPTARTRGADGAPKSNGKAGEDDDVRALARAFFKG